MSLSQYVRMASVRMCVRVGVHVYNYAFIYIGIFIPEHACICKCAYSGNGYLQELHDLSAE